MNKTLAIIIAAFASMSVNAEEWIDVTDTYVKNPRYDGNNLSFWQGTPLGAVNSKENAEHYQKNYDTYQDISGLAPGKYRVSLNAFYRMGDSSNDYNLYTSGNYEYYQYAKLYATSSVDDYEVSIAPSSSGRVKESLGGASSGVGNQTGGWWSPTYEYYIPNNMEAAYYWFEAGYYQNTVECKVGDDGTLRIGIRKFTTQSGDWTCIDNWKLEYWGIVKNVESITFNPENLGLVLGEKYHIQPIVAPSDATYQKMKWTVKDTRIATIDSDGNVTAVGVGSTVITATATDDSGKKATLPISVYTNNPSSANIVINEIMAANIDVYLDPNQNYGSWVELYNPTDKSTNLGGLYITDDPDNLKKHKLVDDYGALPAHGFAILNFDHHEVWTEMAYRQIDDKLDCDGGIIIISDGKNILAQQEYPEAKGRISYGRTTDGGDIWGYAGAPTPGATNVNGAFASEQLEVPVIDKDAQLFNGSMQICVNIPVGATLKYTTDGTAPSLTNGEVSLTGIFNITGTTNFRFRLFKEGFLPSKVVTRSYIEDNGRYTFPIISIVTDRDNIYSNSRGAFMQGEFGRPGNGQSGKCNWNMDWDHPVSFEYITTDNECVISQECDFSMCGGWSRAYTPHSFKLKANNAYDLVNTFDYQFFADKSGLKHKTLQVRNGGNDNNNRIKDAALQKIVASSGLYIESQAWQPAHVFINGEHYAVLNVREPNNKHYAYTNYGIDTDEMDQFEMSPDSGYVQMEGTKDCFDKWYELSETAYSEESYEEICKIVDIDEYTNYMATELYLGNWDWPQNNVKGFRDVNDGKFHFVLFDLDGSFNTDSPFETFFNKEHYTFDSLHGYDYSRGVNVTGQRNYQEIQFVTIFKNMLNNDEFRKKFIDAFCIINGSVYTPERVNEIVSGMASYVSTENWVNPWGTANDIINRMSTNRQNTLMNSLRNYYLFNLSSVSPQTASISSNIDAGQILLNDQPIPTGKLKGTVFAPITLKAVAPAGYKFKGWATGATKEATAIFSNGDSWNYYDKGSLDGENWKIVGYNVNKWKNGKTPIGYGKNQVTNTEGYLTTYYFRKTFTLTNTPSSSDEFVLDFTIDDGMVVYVNGEEAGRYNMPSGNVKYDTFASSYAPNNPDTGTLTLDANLFKKGSNVIAVEVHNNSSTSSDILWDASLTLMSTSTNASDIASTDPEYTCPTAGKIDVTAIWEEMTEEEMIAEGLNTTPIIINEISASNSVYVNEYFKKNDWIELHNTTSEDIDIAGLYISDNLSKPQKYQIPTDNVTLNTVIPAHGYKVVWCDKLDNISDVIHTSFKLAAEGGDVMIANYANNKSDIVYADTITYTPHSGQQSFGCYPDAGLITYVMDKPTPGAANIYTSYAVEYVAPEPEPTPNAIAMVRDGSMTIAFIDGVVNVKSEDAPITSASIYSVAGTKVASNMIRNTGSFVSLNVSGLTSGVYVAYATNANGDVCKVKFAIK